MTNLSPDAHASDSYDGTGQMGLPPSGCMTTAPEPTPKTESAEDASPGQFPANPHAATTYHVAPSEPDEGGL